MNDPKDIFESKQCVFENPWLMVRQWYSSELGQAFLAQEQHELNSLLEHVFGYHMVQLGCLDQSGLTTGSRTAYQFVFESLQQSTHANSCTQVNCRFDDLPLQNQSLDAVILPHTLEFEQNPHQILREVERVLVAEGKAILLGFNPFSVWGFWHKYWEMKNRISNKNKSWQVPLPSCGHLLSQKRLRDWLQLLGFDIELVNEYFYRPPLRSSVLLNKLEFIEHAGQISKILPAGAYLMVATKRVSTLTPIPQKWKLSKAIIGSETAEPAGFKRSIFREKDSNG